MYKFQYLGCDHLIRFIGINNSNLIRRQLSQFFPITLCL